MLVPLQNVSTIISAGREGLTSNRLGFKEVVCNELDTFREPFFLHSLDDYRKILEYEPAGHIWMSHVEALQIMTPASTDIDKENRFIVLPRPWAEFCGHWERFMPIHQTLPANGHVVIQVVSPIHASGRKDLLARFVSRFILRLHQIKQSPITIRVDLTTPRARVRQANGQRHPAAGHGIRETPPSL
jgi:hypothetical protein